MTLYVPCIKSVGPANAKIVLLGEAPGEQEERTGFPFIGSAGQELDNMCEAALLPPRRDMLLTNVLFTRPAFNKMENVSVKSDFIKAYKKSGAAYPLKAVASGRYLHPDLLPELVRLRSELMAHPRNLIVALGNTALWALTESYGISKVRGTTIQTPFGKVLATYHPSAVLRDWSLRPIVIADLMKAKREAEFPEIRRPTRYALINPTLQEVVEWCAAAHAARRLSVDVETKGGSITCLGIATDKSTVLVCPFFSWARRPNSDLRVAPAIPLPPLGSYWTKADEIVVRRSINSLLKSSIPKLFQNGMYDIQYLLKEGYKLWNCNHDSMLIQHALYPELPKSLGFLGSVHTNEPAWKLMRPRGDEQNKRDDE